MRLVLKWKVRNTQKQPEKNPEPKNRNCEQVPTSLKIQAREPQVKPRTCVRTRALFILYTFCLFTFYHKTSWLRPTLSVSELYFNSSTFCTNV